MPEKKPPLSDISRRLSTLVDELSSGNSRQFSSKAGVNQATFHNYLKGRAPNTEALYNICCTYKVNLNWLVAGIGPKYIKEHQEPEVVARDQGTRFQIVNDVQEWLAEICEEEPERKEWLKIELVDKIPNFKEWLKKRRGAEAEAS